MSTAIVQRDQMIGVMEQVVVKGNLAELKTEDRLKYYQAICDSVGLNPLTRPFEYITLNGKLTLYARKDATDQLRNIHKVSVTISAREVVEECYVVTARATMPDGRTDESIGAVPIGNLKGDARCNALMKGETKAKRRVTLSICGLGMLDETEIETIPSARPEVAIVTKEPITFKKSTPVNSGQDGQTTSKGHEVSTPPPQGVDTVSEGATTSPSPTGTLITSKQASDLHNQFRAVLKKELPALYLQTDKLFYGYMKKAGFVTASGEPSAGAITVSQYDGVITDLLLAFPDRLKALDAATLQKLAAGE